MSVKVRHGIDTRRHKTNQNQHKVRVTFSNIITATIGRLTKTSYYTIMLQHTSQIGGVKFFLHRLSKMKDLGAATFLLEMEITRLPGGDIQLL